MSQQYWQDACNAAISRQREDVTVTWGSVVVIHYCYMFFIVTLCTPARCEAATPATIYIPNPPSECRIPRLCCCKRLVVLDVEAARCFTSTACLEALRVVLCAHVRRMLYKRPVEPCLDVVFG
jgi:hypothetical protein